MSHVQRRQRCLENQPGEPAWKSRLLFGRFVASRHKALVKLVWCQFSRLSKVVAGVCSGPFFASSVASESVWNLLKCLMALRRRGPPFLLLILLEIFQSACSGALGRPQRNGMPKISNSIYGFRPVPRLKAALERCLSTQRRGLSSCLERQRPGLFKSPSCAVSPL